MGATPTAADEPALQAPLPLGKVVVVGIGNALEYYDFLTFSYFSIQIGHTFFPTSNGLLLTLATFGFGFVTRPLGGFVIGRYGDRVGRKPAMLWSFGLMGIGIVGLALIPSYEQIGVAAPVMLVIFRLLQGFAVGGEVGPSTAFLVESAPDDRRGLYAALQAATQYLAIVESLPRSSRSGVFGVLYALAVAVFGGSTQFVIKWLIDLTGNPLAPAWYMSGALLAGGVAIALLPESAPCAKAIRRP